MPWFQPSSPPPTQLSLTQNNDRRQAPSNEYENALQRSIASFLPSSFFLDENGRGSSFRQSAHPCFRTREVIDSDNNSFFRLSRGQNNPLISPIQIKPQPRKLPCVLEEQKETLQEEKIEHNMVQQQNSQHAPKASPFSEDEINPRRLFKESENTYRNKNYEPPPNSHKQSQPQQQHRQATLTRDTKGTVQCSNDAPSREKIDLNWNEVGKIASVSDRNVENAVTNAPKRKSKKSKLKKKHKAKNSQGIAASFEKDKDDNHNIEVVSVKERKKRSKKRRFCDGLPSSNTTNTEVVWTETTFEGIEDCAILNVGSCEKALDCFLKAYRDVDYLTWTIIFLDRDLTTPFQPSSQKYCTEKGPSCTHWNCTCDNQVRGVQARAPVLGAMFVFPAQLPSSQGSSYGGEDSQQSGSEGAGDLKCFILPLGKTMTTDNSPEELPEGFQRMSKWPFVPFACGAPLQERWDALRKILVQKRGPRCVTFNAVVGLLPYHFHFSQVGTRPLDLIITSVLDIRLAAWIMRPHAKEKELEFESIKSGFPHLSSGAIAEAPENASEQLRQLVNAKSQLMFLYALYPIISRSIERKNLQDSFAQIEGPLQSILSAMECEGVGFLPERLSNHQQKLEKRIDELTAEARHIAKDNSLLLSSPQQVSSLLFDKLHLQIPSGIQSKIKAGSSHRSTSEEILEAMQSTSPHPIIPIILEHRNLNKLLTTYIRPLPELARHPSTRSKKPIVRIHPMWVQTAVRTGRLSCRKPNMQQIPREGAFGIVPRDSFCASSARMCLFACDYSQNEVRILAHMSNDQNLIKMFREESVDIYKQMSSFISGKAVEEVTDKERSKSKQMTLAVLYGMGIQQVAKKLGVDYSTAQQFQNQFFQRFRGVKRWIDETKKSARENGYVTTIVGRRRYLDEIHSNDKGKKAQAERQAVNTIIQGSAADLMKLAMLKMASRIMDWNKEGVNTGGTGVAPKLVLQIHDELLFEVVRNKDDVTRLKDAVLRCCGTECESDLRLKVPLKLKCSCGLSWGNAMKELE